MQERPVKATGLYFKTMPNTPYATNNKKGAHLLCLGLFLLAELCTLLGNRSLLLSLTGGLGLLSLGVHLLLDNSLTSLLSLRLVDLISVSLLQSLGSLVFNVRAQPTPACA